MELGSLPDVSLLIGIQCQSCFYCCICLDDWFWKLLVLLHPKRTSLLHGFFRCLKYLVVMILALMIMQKVTTISPRFRRLFMLATPLINSRTRAFASLLGMSLRKVRWLRVQWWHSLVFGESFSIKIWKHKTYGVYPVDWILCI